MKQILFSVWLYRAFRVVLGGVFVLAGTLKLADVQAFGETIAHFGLAPPFLVPAVAFLLPLLEVGAGIGLLFDLKGSLASIASMLVVFLLILWFGIVRDLDVDCGCFSTSEMDQKNSLAQAFYRDVVLLGVVLYLYTWRFFQKHRQMKQLPSGGNR